MLKSLTIVAAVLILLSGEARPPMAADAPTVVEDTRQQPGEVEAGMPGARRASTTTGVRYGPPTPPEVRSEEWVRQLYGPILSVAPDFLRSRNQDDDARDRD